jgi:hypothetical protein
VAICGREFPSLPFSVSSFIECKLIFAWTNNERDEATRHNVNHGELFRAINLSLVLMKAIGMVTITPARHTLNCPLFYDMKVSRI